MEWGRYMSVLKNKRTVSSHQFKVNYYGIASRISHIVNKISKRRRKFIPHKLKDTLFDLQHNLIMLDTQARYSSIDVKIPVIKKSINLLYSLIDCIFDILVLSGSEISRGFVVELETRLNDEAELLYKELEKAGVHAAMRKIKLYDRNKVSGVTYLEKLLRLHKNTLSKIIHLSPDCALIITEPLYVSSIQAFKHAYRANLIYPDSKSRILKRREHFNHVLSYLESYEQALFELFTHADYQDDIILNFTQQIVECNKLVKSIIKSDSKILKKFPN